MRKEREITIKFIKNNNINNRRLVEYFAKKYIENTQIKEQFYEVKS